MHVMRAVRKHLPFVIVVVGGVVLRVLAVLAYQPALMLQRDAYVYLEMAAGGVSSYRPPLYPMLLKPALALGNLTVVAVSQHLVGLGLGFATYILLRRLGVGRWAGAVGAAPILLDAYQVDLEHYVLTETLFQTLLMGAVLLLVWAAKPPPASLAAAGLLIAMCGITRFVGFAVIVPALLYLLWSRLGWLRVTSLCAGFAITLGVYAVWIRGTQEGAPDIHSGFFLYGRVASFADCNEVPVPLELRPFCLDKSSAEDRSRGAFALDLPMQELRTDPEANAKLLDFSRRMIMGKPLAYVQAVLADLWRYVEPTSPPNKESYVDRWLFVSSVEEAQPHPYVASLRGSPPTDLGIDQTFRIDRRFAAWLRSYQRLGYLWGPALGVCVLLGVAGAFGGVRRIRGRDVRPVSGLFAFAALALLLGAVMATVYHFRYVIAPLPLVGPAGVLGSSLLWRRFVATKADVPSAAQQATSQLL